MVIPRVEKRLKALEGKIISGRADLDAVAELHRWFRENPQCALLGHDCYLPEEHSQTVSLLINQVFDDRKLKRNASNLVLIYEDVERACRGE